MIDYNPFSLKGKTILIQETSSEISQSLRRFCEESESRVVDIPDNYSNEELTSFVNQAPFFDGVSLTVYPTKAIMSQFVTEEDTLDFFREIVLEKIMLCKALFKKKKIGKNSSIVFSSPVAGIDNVHFGDIYNATFSSALRGLSKSLALEYGMKGIRVNHIRYGVLATKDLLDNKLLSQEELAEKESFFPMKRFGKPEEVANAILFLLSDASSWITGTDLRIDGGYSIL